MYEEEVVEDESKAILAALRPLIIDFCTTAIGGVGPPGPCASEAAMTFCFFDPDA